MNEARAIAWGDYRDAAGKLNPEGKDLFDELKGKGLEKGVFPLSDIRLYECPLSYITDETWEIVRLVYLVEDSGHLLHAGGLGDQPTWLAEAMEIHKIEQSAESKRPNARKS